MKQQKRKDISKYYSKKYKAYYIKTWGENGYEKWRKIEKQKILGVSA